MENDCVDEGDEMCPTTNYKPKGAGVRRGGAKERACDGNNTEEPRERRRGRGKDKNPAGTARTSFRRSMPPSVMLKLKVCENTTRVVR